MRSPSPSTCCSCRRSGLISLALTTVLYCYVTISEGVLAGSSDTAPADLSYLPTIQYLQTPAVNGDPEGPYVKLTRVTPVDQDPKLPSVNAGARGGASDADHLGTVDVISLDQATQVGSVTASHRNLYTVTALLLPPATELQAGPLGKLASDVVVAPTGATWSVERLCHYEGILEPESVMNLPRPLEDYPPIGCSDGGGGDGWSRQVDAPGALPLESEGLGTAASLHAQSTSMTGMSLQGSELQTAGTAPSNSRLSALASGTAPALDESFVGIQLSLARGTRDSLPLPGVTSDVDLLFVRPARPASPDDGVGGARSQLPKGHIVGDVILEVLCQKREQQQPLGGRHRTTYIKLWATAMASQREWAGSELASACVWSASGSSRGARFLNDMTRGVVTKRDVELVFSHHKRDMGWSDIFAPIRTVYHKGDTPVEGFNNELPNVGRESHTYLSHIINNYDKLAQNTVFLQDHRPGIGLGFGRDQHHFHSRSTLMDYLTSATSTYFILGNAITPDMALEMGRLGTKWNVPLRRPLPQFVSTNWELESDPQALELDTWLPGNDADGFRRVMGRSCSAQSGSMRYADCWIGISDVWRDLARYSPALPREPPWEAHADVLPPAARLIFFAQGGTMAVSRDAVHRHPKAFYQRAIDHLGISMDPIAGYYMELMWYYIFEPGADEAALMTKYSQQMAAAGIRPDMGTDEVMAKLLASKRMRAHGVDVPAVLRGIAEEREQLLRRQLAEVSYVINCTAASFASSVAVEVRCPTNILIPAEFVLTLDNCTESSSPFTAEEFLANLAQRLGLQTCNIAVSVTVNFNGAGKRHRRQLLQTLNQVLVGLELYPDTPEQAQQVVAVLASQTFLDFLTNTFAITGGAVIDAALAFEVLEILLLDSGTSDPHFVTAHGDKFDFNGVAGESFCILADEHIHVNAHFMGPAASNIADASGHGAGLLEAIPQQQPLMASSSPDASSSTPAASDAASIVAPVPQGEDARTWMDAVAVMYGDDRILVQARTLRRTGFPSAFGTVRVNGELLDGSSAFTVLPSGLSVTRKKTRVQVTVPGLATVAVEVVRAEFWERGKGPGANFLNLQIKGFNGTANVHGVLGQSMFAQKGDGQRALVEGTSADYMTSGLYATDCTYGRWILTRARR